MKSAVLVVLAASIALGRSGCGGPSAPTPNPSPTSSPSPTVTPYPPGVPNAPAFGNIAHATGLERASGRGTVLVSVQGNVTLAGLVTPGSSWYYAFADPKSTIPVRLFLWNVLPDGRVESSTTLDVLRLDLVDLTPRLVVDSSEAVRLGRRYGAESFVQRYPECWVELNYRYVGRLAVCQMIFTAGRCRMGPVIINAESGELLSRTLNCPD